MKIDLKADTTTRIDRKPGIYPLCLIIPHYYLYLSFADQLMPHCPYRRIHGEGTRALLARRTLVFGGFEDASPTGLLHKTDFSLCGIAGQNHSGRLPGPTKITNVR